MKNRNFETLKLPDGTLMPIENLEKCSECGNIPWCLVIDMHEYGHKKECSRS